MTARLLSRERGCVIACDHGALASSKTHCEASHYTAVIRIGVNRAEAAKAGWIRGGGAAAPAVRPSGSTSAGCTRPTSGSASTRRALSKFSEGPSATPLELRSVRSVPVRQRSPHRPQVYPQEVTMARAG